MHFHLARRDLLNHLNRQYYYSAEDALKICDYLESSGQISFNGGMFLINSPTAQDAKNIETLGRGALGQAPGGSTSYYSVKAYLDLLLRQSMQYTAKRGLTTT